MMNTEHEYWQEQLSAEVDGRLDAHEHAALFQHLAGCTDCRQELEQLRQTVAFVRLVPSVAAPRSFALRPMDVEMPAPASGGWWSWLELLTGGAFREGLRLTTAVAALLLVGVMIYDFSATVMSPARINSSADSAAGGAASMAAPAPAAGPVQRSALKGSQDTAATTTQSAPAAESGGAAAPTAPGAGVGATTQSAPATAGAPSAAPPLPFATAMAGGEAVPSGPMGRRTQEPQTSNFGQDASTGARGVGFPLRLVEAALGAVVVAGGAALIWSRRRT